MPETLIEKAQRLNIKPDGKPETLLEKARRLGIEPAGKPKPAEIGKGLRFLKGAGEFAIGIPMGGLKTIRGAAALGEKGLSAITGAILPEAEEKAKRFISPAGKTSAEELIPEKFVTPTTPAMKAGFIGEQIAEFFIPGALPEKLGLAAISKIEKGGKLIKGAVKLGTKAITEAGLAGGQTALQKGKIDEEVKISAIAGGIIPPVLKVGGLTIKGAGKGIAEVLGKATGASADAIYQTFKDSRTIKFAREAGQNIEQFQDNLLNDVKNGLNRLKQTRAAQYLSRLELIKTGKENLDDISRTLRNKTVELMKGFDITIKQQTDELGKKLNVIDVSKSTLIEGANIVERALNDVMSWTDNTAGGLDKLKQRLSIYADQLTGAGKDRARAFVLGLKDTLRSSLEKNVKGYKEMTRSYHEASDLIDTIVHAFSLKNPKAKETAIKKIMTALRQNNETRKELLNILGDDLISKVAGAQLSPLAPRGLAGTLGGITGGAGIVTAFLKPQTIPLILTSAMLSSPRIVAELVNILGKITSQMIKVNKFSPEIERGLRELFIKIQKQEK